MYTIKLRYTIECCHQMKLYERERPWKVENDALKSRLKTTTEEFSRCQLALEHCRDVRFVIFFYVLLTNIRMFKKKEMSANRQWVSSVLGVSLETELKLDNPGLKTG